jgi:hypothetical protein
MCGRGPIGCEVIDRYLTDAERERFREIEQDLQQRQWTPAERVE